MKRVATVLGTRPESIKMSSVVRACEGSRAEWFMVHAGQDCYCDMDPGVLRGLELPDARYNLNVGSGSGRHEEQTGKMLSGIEKILIAEKPDAVLVEGDTNTVLAGVLAASDARG